MDNAETSAPARRFGEFLRKKRRAAELTQEEVAERMGASQWAMSNLERGRAVVMPTPEVFHSLLDAVGADACEALEYVGYLRGGRGEPRQTTPAVVFARLAAEIQEAAELPEDAKGIILRAISYAREVAELEGTTTTTAT